MMVQVPREAGGFAAKVRREMCLRGLVFRPLYWIECEIGRDTES